MRNAFFIQLDAVSSFFVLLFFALWRRRLARPTLLNAILLGGCLILAVLQKTTLFPLLAVPLTVAVFEAARDRIWNGRA
jgi:4-amino-4-deoxy-L-arabinose transferase-like glycosyltransferase